ncbi:recombinase family protein [Komagataeibacter swingsii]|uniref:Recombinase family protein n=1 Tax=Komagataeibacter swingsii TaxID=215220 RepID=A0A2V4QWU1_9PROT|nr:recombinase family protein [Komagataeibacter swingsii]PYD69021.1 recombinase family protein [Komagataeibacter swingsii]GBQ56949.1 putative recombinase [Komagataeibacter swingsii DSM 16373]
MVIDWNQRETNNDRRLRAAEYVRMSTDHQEFSTRNQSAAIRAYAGRRGYEIVHTYADEGKSGLNVDGRDAFIRLIDDVESGRADFSAIFVYDISRWGRFQDPDEAAMYELRCRRAGVDVCYCADQFENDGSIGSSIVKTVKRVLAGAHSHDLSVRVFAGQANLIRRGYRQGGAPGFGLRRMLINQNGERKGSLGRGEHKSIATDRVILVPGPEDEISIVQEIYRMFVEDGRSERDIAATLNTRAILTDLGRPWTRGTVHQILINEKYIGHNVWARTSFRLRRAHIRNDPEKWVRINDAFAPIVDRNIFLRARAMIDARSERLSDEAMLDVLRLILEGHGQLSAIIIDEAEGCPSSGAYRSRFRSLLRAYALVGFSPDRDYRYLEINRKLRALHPAVIAGITAGIGAAGGRVISDPLTDLLTVNAEFTVSVAIMRSFLTPAGTLRWKLRLDTALNPDLTIAVRMDEHNDRTKDFYLLPRLDIREAVLRLCEHNGLSLDAYRFDTLDRFYRMAARAAVPRAA